MRSIFVLLILVMIGLNGKGQSVTALPDSVLSQCCLEVTLLNGNVTTVDWVFVQYITRDGTGTKLFVEYAPNFGGIQWETQIRIQDDFDDVLERSKFIVIPFTVGSTDYGINRNWIANIEENTTTGGTWIYGRFGTPTKRKFSAVEDYETMKNLLLACHPRAIVVAENGLYAEGDTVRMGGFLIEPTTITTEGYNWQMKDTLSNAEFGLDYLTPETGDTTVYWARRSGSVRQMMQMGNRYWYNTMKDTVGGLYSNFIHTWNSGDPFLRYLIFNPLAPNSGTAWMQIQRDNSFLLVSNETTNPFYTLGWTVTSTVAQLGANESGSGDPGNGVVMGAYGFGTTEFLFMKTKAVDAGTATNGQYLQLIDNSSGEVDFATIDLSAYLPIADTAAMLDPYIQGAGTLNYLPKFTAGRVVGNSNLFDNNTYAGVISRPWKFGEFTTAGLPTGVTGYTVYNTTTNGLAWYQGSRWAYGLESTFNRGTSGYFPRFDANGQIIDSEARVSSTNMVIALTGGLQIPSGTSAQQASTGAGYLRWNTSLAYPTIFNGSSTQSVLIGPFTGFASGEVMYGASSGGMPSSATTFKWDIANSRLLVGTTSHSFANTTRLVVQQATSNAFIADFRSTAATVFGPIAAMKLTRTDNTVGYGTTFAFYFNNAASAEVDYARFGAYIESNTTGAHSGGLAFYTTNLVTTTQERFRVTSIGRIGINTTTPTHRLHVNGRARIDTTDATPTSLLGVDGSNVLGKFTLGTGLSITSGTLNSTGGTVTSVGLSLPSIFSVSGSPVTSSGTLTGTFTASTTSHVLRGDGDWASSLDYFKINQSLSSVERFEVNGNLVLAREDEGHKLMLSRGWSQQIWGGGVTGDMTYQNGSGSGFQNYFRLGVSGGNDTIVTMHQSGLGVHVGKSNKLLARLHVKGLGTGSSKTMLLEDSGGADILTVTDNKLIQFNAYGTPGTTAAALSKTLTNYGVGFATDGTVTSREIKRDTTIYIDDSDYDFSASITTAQIASRFNRVIFWMTTTAAAGTDSELTLHTPDVNLMQVEYLIHSVDEAGGFDNRIIFGTNNAVDSTNGLVTNYYPSAGQGVHIRAGLRSGVYKYRYSN